MLFRNTNNAQTDDYSMRNFFNNNYTSCVLQDFYRAGENRTRSGLPLFVRITLFVDVDLVDELNTKVL